MGYPKILYRDGLAASVNDAPEEAAYVEAGWAEQEPQSVLTPAPLPEPVPTTVPVTVPEDDDHSKVKKGAKKK